MKNRLCQLLGIKYPIIQGPMAWISGSELVAAVSNAGGLGTIAPNAGATFPTKDIVIVEERIRGQIRKTKSLTSKPFAVNIAVGLGYERAFSDLFVEVCIDEGVEVAVVSQGSARVYTARLKENGIKVLHLVSIVEHARKAEAAGVDAIVTSGCEGGGHSGWEQLTTFTMVPQVVDAVDIPVVAGGGIGDARGLVAALALGADGVYMGTRFMATHECAAHPNAKQAVVEADDTSTVLVGHGMARHLLGGRKGEGAAPRSEMDTGNPLPGARHGMIRRLKGKFVDECLRLEASGASVDEVQAFMNSPVPGRPNMSRIAVGMIEGDLDVTGLSCGQVAGLIDEVVSVEEVVRKIVAETANVMDRLNTLGILS